MEYQENTKNTYQETIENQVYTRQISATQPLPASSTRNNLVFLLLSFPLGLLYFLLTVIGLSVGAGTLVIWIGLPILFITFLVIHALAEAERRMVNALLHIPVVYRQSARPGTPQGFLRSFGRLLSDPYTWTGMLYMILKLPIGIFNFTLALVMTTLSAALTFLPLVYVINLLVTIVLAQNGIAAQGYIIPGFIEVHGYFDLVAFGRSFAGVPLGIVVWLVSRPLLNGLALISGELARALLGPGVASLITQPHSTSYIAPEFRENEQVWRE